MAITYNSGTDTITVIGYTEATPCVLTTDSYNSDKAGTLSLHARTGITAADGAAVAVDRAERPTDYIVLGGASNDLYIVVANWNGTNATIRITGTDRDGAAQTEDIVVNANGTYYTTKWFKTITHTQVTAAAVTSFDYDLTQGQWGVVSRQCTNQFCFNCKVVIGDGSTVTWVADTKKLIIFPNGSVAHLGNNITLKANSHFRLGTLNNDANKETSGGCCVYDYNAVAVVFLIKADASLVICELYQSCFIGVSGRKLLDLYPGCSTSASKMYNCNFSDGFEISSCSTSCYNVLLTNSIYAFARVAGTMDTISIKRITGAGSPALYTTDTGEASSTFKNFVVRNVGVLFKIYAGTTLHQYLVNMDSDNWLMSWYGTPPVRIYRQYEFDLKVIDKDNVVINGATVKIWDKDSNLIVDTTTNASGVIATQTITRGYYNQANGNTLQEASPHLIKITKAGYTMYEADFTLGDKTDWLIALQTSILRNPSMTGGMV